MSPYTRHGPGGRVWAGVLALAVLAAGAGCKKKTAPSEPAAVAPAAEQKPAEAPARAVLTHAWGGGDGAAMLRLCVWTNSGQLAAAPDKVEFLAASNRWGGAYGKVEQGIAVMKTGAVETIYRVDPAARLGAGAKLKAAVWWGTNGVESGPVILAEAPTGTVERLDGEFDWAMLAGDPAAALQAASNRIRLDEQAYEGHWMEGLALEAMNNREAARAAYERALAR